MKASLSYSKGAKTHKAKIHQLEKDLPGLKQQLNRFSEINPEECPRLREASSKKVLAAITEHDGAQTLVLALRKERLLERAFLEAEGHTGSDSSVSFFDVFRGKLYTIFRLCTSKDVNTPDSLEPLDGISSRYLEKMPGR